MNTVYSFLIDNKQITNKLIRYGLMPSRYANILKIYLTYQEHYKINGRKASAVNYCTKYYRCSRQHVYNVINELESEI